MTWNASILHGFEAYRLDDVLIQLQRTSTIQQVIFIAKGQYFVIVYTDGIS